MHFVFQESEREIAARRSRHAAICAQIAATQMWLSATKLDLLQKQNFNPAQARVPVGNPGGGQWTGGAGLLARPRARKGTTEADNRAFVVKRRADARKLAKALGRGADADEFLALSSVESTWGTSDAASATNNYFGIHNSQRGPYPGQTDTYISSGIHDVPGQLVSGWIPPLPDGSQKQAVAAFAPSTGFLDSGMVAVARLKQADADYSNPATFFATVHSHGWAEGANAAEYVHTLLQRYRHVGRY